MNFQVKASSMNIVTERVDRIFVFNTLSRSFLALEPEVWRYIEASKFGELSDDEISTLLGCGILLPSEVDESKIVQSTMQFFAHQQDALSIFLSVTSGCNLRCPYCYQDCRKQVERNEYISKESFDVFLKMVGRNPAPKLNLVYFGGEPTLDESRLLWMINRVRKDVDKSVHSTLITNGCLISKRLIETIKDDKSFDVQLTLDGDRDLHNQIRIGSNKEPTYDLIFETIERLLAAISGVVLVRINVSSTNFDAYKRAIDDLYGRFGNRIGVQLAAVFDGQCQRNNPEIDGNVDIIELFEYARSVGYPVLPDIEISPCIASVSNGMAVDENLNVYPCPARLYQKASGIIKEDGTIVITDNEWYSCIYDHPECTKECLYGSLCYGGCLLKDHKCNKKHFERLVPYVISKKIETYYQEKAHASN